MAVTKKQTNQKMPPRSAMPAVSARPLAGNTSRSNVNYQEKPKSRNYEEPEVMPLGMINYILIGVSLLLIVLGFILMSGSGNEGSTFNNDVFSSTRIVVAPFITFLGFLLMVPAILIKGKKNNDEIPSLPVNAKNNTASSSNIIVNRK